MSTGVTADATSCSTLALFSLSREENKPKIRMHIEHCLSSAKVIPIKVVQKLFGFGAATSDAENLCDSWLASMIFFWRFFVPKALE